MAKLAPNLEVSRLRVALLTWYERHRRDLPWRRTSDPYAIWVSEIMLQQTRVAVVIERYRAFMERFPTVSVLAAAPEQEVLALWSGLGYYRRARMLHKAAQMVVAEREGKIPETAAELLGLPGVGGYTSAAIASIAHDEPVAVVDGNVERVICRLAGWEQSSGRERDPQRRRIEEFAAKLLDMERPGDFNQAMMELGATVCLPRNPQCLVCPLREGCQTRGEHKTAPRPRMESREAEFALCVRTPMPGRNPDTREVLLEQRPASMSVMPGLWELPALPNPVVDDGAVRMTVRHAIMNVNYMVRIQDVDESELNKLAVKCGERRWVPLSEVAGMALTGLARKVLKRANLMAAPDVHGAAFPVS
ncbi:MAG TPA: A/G-specific adenine glycosylase [Terracidiphilus sp.]|nr:A/G-specific adenine glycosylase [Terracidiphilus sp.]